MRITNDALKALGETIEDLKTRVETMMEQQSEAIEKEELKDSRNEEKIQEMESINEILQDVFNNLEAANESVSQGGSREDD